MSESLHRLVYYSRNRAVNSPEGMAIAIERILAAARRNNPSASLTGALMFNAGCFAQVLEGPEAAVMHMFERIQQDERHGDVTVLSFGAVTARVFDRWSMGFVGESMADSERYQTVAGDSGYDPSRMTGDTLLETLHRLILEDERPGSTD